MSGEVTIPKEWRYHEEHSQPVQVDGQLVHELLRVDFGSIYVTKVVGPTSFFRTGYLTRDPATDAPWLHTLGFRVESTTELNPVRFPGSQFVTGDRLHIPSLERSYKAIEELTGKTPALVPVRVPFAGQDDLTYAEQAGALLDSRLAAKNAGKNAVHDQIVHLPSLFVPSEFWADTQDTLYAFAEMSAEGRWAAAQDSFANYMMLQDAVSAFAPSLVEPPIFRSLGAKATPLGAKAALSRVIAGGEHIRAGDLRGATEVLTKDESVVPLSSQGQELFNHTVASVQGTIQVLERAA